MENDEHSSHCGDSFYGLNLSAHHQYAHEIYGGNKKHVQCQGL
jgi:hypothetical protein